MIPYELIDLIINFVTKISQKIMNRSLRLVLIQYPMECVLPLRDSELGEHHSNIRYLPEISLSNDVGRSNRQILH